MMFRNTQAAKIATVVATCFILQSCVTSRVDMAFDNQIDNSGEAGVVLLTRRDNVKTETEVPFVDCVKKRLTSGTNSIVLKEEQIFLDSLFPWFEPRVAPLTVEALPDLLGKPGVSEKVSDAGVRYVMWLGGSVETKDGGGSITCDASVGCFGFTWWENGATYEASIWDLENLESTGVISADVTGRSYIPAIVVPIPLIARTKTAACSEMAEQIKGQFTG
ncbi:MAG: hypothetical protein AB8G18_11945 [Gammaproteobacteria bacterium]